MSKACRHDISVGRRDSASGFRVGAGCSSSFVLRAVLLVGDEDLKGSHEKGEEEVGADEVVEVRARGWVCVALVAS